MKERFKIKEVFDLLGEEDLKTGKVLGFDKNSEHEIIVEGRRVYTMSYRYKLFYNKGCTCVECGRKGAYFKLVTTGKKRAHFDLYAEDGVLMTKDHIIPKALGGANDMSNFQTMCEICNKRKGCKMPE